MLLNTDLCGPKYQMQVYYLFIHMFWCYLQVQTCLQSTERVPAARLPYRVKVSAEKRYAWCACGHSQKQVRIVSDRSRAMMVEVLCPESSSCDKLKTSEVKRNCQYIYISIGFSHIFICILFVYIFSKVVLFFFFSFFALYAAARTLKFSHFRIIKISSIPCLSFSAFLWRSSQGQSSKHLSSALHPWKEQNGHAVCMQGNQKPTILRRLTL